MQKERAAPMRDPLPVLAGVRAPLIGAHLHVAQLNVTEIAAEKVAGALAWRCQYWKFQVAPGTN